MGGAEYDGEAKQAIAAQALSPKPLNLDEKITVLVGGFAVEMTRREVLSKVAVSPPSMDIISAMLKLAEEGVTQYNALSQSPWPMPGNVRKGQVKNLRDMTACNMIAPEAPPARAKIRLGDDDV